MGGIIAAGDQLTADAGILTLESGGNAIDAAVAAAFTSFVAEIGVVQLGGSGFAHIYDAQNGRSLVYDFFSNAPGLGSKTLQDKDNLERVTIRFDSTKQNFYLGRASVAVPGNIMGLTQMAADHGRLPLAKLLEPSISIAERGIEISKFQAETCKLLEPIYIHTPEMRDIFAPSGDFIKPHQHLIIPNLSSTLHQIAIHGAKYARRESWQSQDTKINQKEIRETGLAKNLLEDQKKNGGYITPTDLIAYNVYRLPSIRIDYYDYEILLPPPSSTGGILIGFALKLLEKINIRQWKYNSYHHLMALCEVMAATNRARTFWDSWYSELSTLAAIDKFLSEPFVSKFAKEISSALSSDSPSNIFFERKTPKNTSHISVIDSEGLAVSLTTTAGEGAGFILPSTGFIPNNIMGEPDLFQAGLFSQTPGTRIQTMMAPTIVLQNEHPYLVLGSGGSIRIRSAILQVLNNFLDYKFPLNLAVNLPRIHLEKNENGVTELHYEEGVDNLSVQKLHNVGYQINHWKQRNMYFGGVNCASYEPSGKLTAIGDSRRGGKISAF